MLTKLNKWNSACLLEKPKQSIINWNTLFSNETKLTSFSFPLIETKQIITDSFYSLIKLKLIHLVISANEQTLNIHKNHEYKYDHNILNPMSKLYATNKLYLHA